MMQRLDIDADEFGSGVCAPGSSFDDCRRQQRKQKR